MDPSSVMGGHSGAANSFIVSRPEHVSSGHVAPVSVGRPEAPASSNNGLFSAPVTVTQAPAAPPPQAGDSFANFANFDAVAFESLPAGNYILALISMIITVLMNKKPKNQMKRKFLKLLSSVKKLLKLMCRSVPLVQLM